MRSKKKETTNKSRREKPILNSNKKSIGTACIIGVAALLIVWVLVLCNKAQEEVSIVMINQEVPKNTPISEDMLREYPMTRAEFEKFSTVRDDGSIKRRILLWEERDLIVGSFSAYPLHKDTYAEYRYFIKSKVDSSDNVLYAFPGKEVIKLDVGTNELQAFKTFLQPGDKINVYAITKDSENIENAGASNETVETLGVEKVLNNVMIADMTNSNGESVLDIYEAYRAASAYEQAQMDSDASFQESVEPKTLLVALTPEELKDYFDYTNKGNVTFEISLPQRVE